MKMSDIYNSSQVGSNEDVNLFIQQKNTAYREKSSLDF